MKIDFLHNKIVAGTVTEKFTDSLTDWVMPKLREKYGSDLEGVQMYEDHLADGFARGKVRYYPLSVATISRGVLTEWISWTVKKGAFTNDVPYAYIGSEPLAFEFCDEVPEEFVSKLSGRSRYFNSRTVKLRVETTATDLTVLAGKYSQTFIDEMARQLTGVISNAVSISGLEDSSIELAVVFAPETYMEHTSESVTYRRLLLVDKSSAPRDFWIKWTRLDGNGAYTMADAVSEGDILFEIGEGVSQKIKEKEYRFLTKAGKDKYHNAMGRKNVTDWREVLKRAVKRGDLVRVLTEEAAPAEKPVRVAVAAKSEEIAVSASVAPAKPVEDMTEDDELAMAMEMARRAIDSVNASEPIIDEEEEEIEEPDELEAFYAEEEPVPEKPRRTEKYDEEEARELDEITRMAMEALKLAKENAVTEENEAEVAEQLEEIADEPSLITFDTPAEEEGVVIVPKDPTEEEYVDGEVEDIFDEESLEDEDAVAEARALEPEEESAPVSAPVEEEETTPISAADLEAKIRGEIEARIRLEYESQARQKAEEEAQRLRREQEQLRLENERLQDRARREKAEWTRLEENRKAEAERMKAQIEAQLRQEAKERERLAEAARLAVEEQHRLEAERLRAEREKLEEERRLEAERRRKEEEARIEAARRAEAEKARRAEEERLAKEKAEKSEAGYVDNNYTYVSKTVRLLFRRSVDPNITARIHEILKATLEYYGKSKVYMRIKATVPNSTTVCLDFIQFPQEEMELLSNIIKVIGNSNLGIAKAILE